MVLSVGGDGSLIDSDDKGLVLGAGVCLLVDGKINGWSCSEGDMGTVPCRERWDGFLPILFGGWTSVLAMTVPAPAKRGAPPPRRAAEKLSSWSVAVWGGGGQEKLPWGRGGIYANLRDGEGLNILRARVGVREVLECGWVCCLNSCQK